MTGCLDCGAQAIDRKTKVSVYIHDLRGWVLQMNVKDWTLLNVMKSESRAVSSFFFDVI